MVLASAHFGCFECERCEPELICGLYSQIHFLDVLSMTTHARASQHAPIFDLTGSKAISDLKTGSKMGA